MFNPPLTLVKAGSETVEKLPVRSTAPTVVRAGYEMLCNMVLLAIWNPLTVCRRGMLMLASWVLLLIDKSPVIRVRLFAWMIVKVLRSRPMDPVTFARALIERLPTCWTVMFPQLVIAGNERDNPAALAATRRDVPISVKVLIEMVLRYWLLVIESTSARLRLNPFRLSRRVSWMMTEADVTPPNPRDLSTGRVTKSIPPTDDKEGREIEFNCVN